MASGVVFAVLLLAALGSAQAQGPASAPAQSPGLTNLNSAVKFAFNVTSIQKDGSWVNVSPTCNQALTTPCNALRLEAYPKVLRR